MARASRGPARAGVLGLLLLVGSSLLVVPASPGSAAPAAKPRPTSLAELRAEVDRTSKRLAAGAAAWDLGQQQLGIQVQRKFDADRALEALQLQAVDAQGQIASLANSLYRNPVNPVLTASMAGDARLLVDTLYLRRQMNQDQESVRVSTDLLTTRARQAEALRAQLQQAALAVTRLQSRLDAQLTDLQSEVAASQVRLQKLLADMRAREAARLRAAQGGGAGCSSPVPAMAINGFLPPSALCFLRTAPGHRLVMAAARAYDAMSTAYAADNGRLLCLTDSYRDYGAQVDVFRRKPDLAATPGRSQHGWGLAVDLCGGVQSFGHPAHEWMKRRAGEFGFFHPAWAQAGGTRPEPWHWEYSG